MASTSKALIGLFLMASGFPMAMSIVFGGLLFVAFASIGIMLPPLCAFNYVVSFVIGIVLTFYGSKMYFQNETKLVRALFGIMGIYLFILGVLVLVGGAGTPPAIAGAIFLISMATAFILYGFKIDVFKPLPKVVDAYKKAII